MSSPASLGLTMEGNEYRVKGKKGGAIKVNKLTVTQLKAYGAKYTTFTNKNRTKKQVLNKIYAAKSKLRNASNSGNSVASALLNLAAGSSKSSSSYNANLAAAQTIAALAAKPKPVGGKPRVQAVLNVAAAPSSGSIGLMPTFGASGGFRAMGAKGPVKLTKYTVPQLKAYAKKHGANVNALKKKDEILAVIYGKKFGKPLYKMKPLANGTSVNAVVNNLIANALKPAKASSPQSGSLGLLAQMGASGGYRVKGARGPKKVNAKMTVPALKAYAKKHGVNASKMRAKKNILAAIHRKKFGASSSSSSRSSSSSSGPKVITRSEAARRLAVILKSSSNNSSYKRPAVRPRVFGPAAGPVKLTAAQLNKLLN
jgi:hypothetical protein